MDTNPYDALPYVAMPHLGAHPERLFVRAHLAGLSPAPIETARILEIACGVGGNLLPIAAQLPEAEVVGFDLSTRQVELVQGMARAAGLDNVEVFQHDLTESSRSLGRFDYVIAHGLYSWIPDAVREQLLPMVRRVLRLDGVAYVSFNTNPGWHARRTARDLMVWHTRDLEDPSTICEEGREILDFAARHSFGDTYSASLRDMSEFLAPYPDRYVFHDHLAPSNRAFYLKDVVASARAAGLAYLGDAFGAETLRQQLSPQALGRIDAHTDPVVREQYEDFFTGRAFRRALLVAAGLDVGPVDPLRAGALYAAANVSFEHGGPAEKGPLTFWSPDHDRRFTLTDPLAKELVVALEEAWPSPVAVEALVERSGAAREELLAAVVAGFERGWLTLLPWARSPVCPTVSTRPLGCSLARAMVRGGSGAITSRLHIRYPMRSLVQKVLVQLDGTKTLGEVVRAVGRDLLTDELRAEAEAFGVSDPERARQLVVTHVSQALIGLARTGFLVWPPTSTAS